MFKLKTFSEVIMKKVWLILGTKKVQSEFQIKGLDVLKYFLGIEFARSKKGIFVNQKKYVLDLLQTQVYLVDRQQKLSLNQI